MNDDLRVVFESRNRAECSDRALVLASLRIPYQIVNDENSSALIVPVEFSAKAMDQLIQYDDENPPDVVRDIVPIQYQNAAPGLIAYALVICGVTVLAGFAASNSEWIVAGRVDGALIRAGEWWRAITALTLHSGLRHLVGNLVFGAMFGLFAGRLLGPGVAWLAITLAGTLGNTELVTRECVVPRGKSLFFPIANAVSFCPLPDETVEDLRENAKADMDGVTSLSLTIV